MSVFPPPVAKPPSSGAGKLALADTVSAWVNLRSGPGTNYQDIGDIFDNTIVVYYPESRSAEKWVWVEQNSQAGWVHTDFVVLKDISSQTHPPGSDRPTPFDGKIALWHWRGNVLPYLSIEQLAADIKAKAPAVNALWVKTSDGSDWMSRFDNREALAISGPESIARWVQTLQRFGIEFHAWCVPKGQNLTAETDLIIQTCNVPGVKSMILDVEPYEGFWRAPASVVRPYMTRVRQAISPGFHIGMSMDPRQQHFATIFPDEWFPFVDSVHPQSYWSTFRRTPAATLEDAYRVWGAYGRPIIPALQGDASAADMQQAQALATQVYGAKAVSWWRLGVVGSAQWQAINRPIVVQQPTPTPTPITPPTPAPGFADEQVVNPDDRMFRSGSYTGQREFQSFQGTWGWTVHYKNTEPARSKVWAQWVPTIRESGEYEVAVFIPARNATTRNARYRISGVKGVSGQVLVSLDQSKQRNVWAVLGVYDLDKAANNAGMVSLTDLTGEVDRVIAFDAVRWRRVTSTSNPPVGQPGDWIVDGVYVADGFDAPVGSLTDRLGEKLWASGWRDAAPYAKLYLVGTPREAYHTGADLNFGTPYEDKGLPISAPASGVVVFAAELRVWGNVIVIRHDPLRSPTGRVVYTRYGHVQSMRVKVGDRVRRGDQIAEIGDAGGRYIPHLHYDISGTNKLSISPGDWPGKDLPRLIKDYLDPLEFTRANRPPR